jgi:hypothetical protein
VNFFVEMKPGFLVAMIDLLLEGDRIDGRCKYYRPLQVRLAPNGCLEIASFGY